MDRAGAITRLESLREQTYRLETQPRLGLDFLEWYLHTLETFDEVFGPGSSARADFKRIRFEFPPAWQQRSGTQLRQELQVQDGIDLPDSFSIPVGDFHQKRLAEARELFSSLIIEQRRP